MRETGLETGAGLTAETLQYQKYEHTSFTQGNLGLHLEFSSNIYLDLITEGHGNSQSMQPTGSEEIKHSAALTARYSGTVRTLYTGLMYSWALPYVRYCTHSIVVLSL